MKAFFKAERPKEIEFTLMITMTLSRWQELSKVVEDKWPGTELLDAIWRMTQAATRQFDNEDE